MPLTFNHATKRILVPQAESQPLLIQTVLDAIREEEASERGICYDQIATASGKEALGGGVFTGITLALLSTWALQFETGAYQAAVDGGNLADGLLRVANTGSPQVLLRSSAASTLVVGSGGSTAPTASQNATAVWQYLIEAGYSAEQLMRLMAAFAAGNGIGLGGPTPKFRDLANTKDRIVAALDQNGNRTIASRDGT